MDWVPGTRLIVGRAGHDGRFFGDGKTLEHTPNGRAIYVVNPPERRDPCTDQPWRRSGLPMASACSTPASTTDTRTCEL